MGTDEDKFLLGTELRDAIARSILKCLPNIKWKEMQKLVAEFEVELDNLSELERGK